MWNDSKLIVAKNMAYPAQLRSRPDREISRDLSMTRSRYRVEPNIRPDRGQPAGKDIPGIHRSPEPAPNRIVADDAGISGAIGARFAGLHFRRFESVLRGLGQTA
jgi:hypothetical protein